MNDDKLMTTIKEPFAGVRLDVPVEQVVRRGRAVRTRRRLPAAAGALATVAGAAVAAVGLLPAGHPATARLAAWTVTEQPGGTIKVTIRELRNPAGLQARLRADGVPASVSFSPPPAACQINNVPRGTLGPVVTGYPPVPPGQTHVRFHPGQLEYVVINPAAIPSGDGVGIFTNPQATQAGPLQFSLVQASQACTGS
jgi:hypothetical protein